MSVHYKFKSALEYDTVTFDGLHISVKDLKNAILQQKRIGKSTDFDLQVTNAQTKEVYDDENALIPKNTSLLIARIPTVVQKTKQWEGYGGDSTPPAKIDEGGPIAKAVDLSSLDAPEDDKIKAMMSQSTQDYDPSNYMKIRGANQMGAVPPNYRCYKCHQGGHWIKDCTFGQGPDPIEIKKSTGIPRSFMVPVEGPQVQGAMMTPNGSYAVPVLDHQAYTQKSTPPAPVPEPKPEIPEDLLCNICSDLLTDAVMIPCCGNSFCDECIRSVLLESEDHECPDCHEKDISPGTLIPNRFLRKSVSTFKNTTGYVKKPVYRERTEPKPVENTEIKNKKESTPPQEPESTEKAKSDAEEKTVISEADSTEQARNDQNIDFSKDIDINEPAKSESESIPEGPPGVSPRNSPKEQHIHRVNSSREPRERSNRHNKHKNESPRKNTRHRRSPNYSDTGTREDRPGTPTVDEPTGSSYNPPSNAPFNTGAAPPGTLPPMMGTMGSMQGPPQTVPTTYPNQPQMAPFPPAQGPPPNFRLPPPGTVPPPYMAPGPYPVPPRAMFDASRPPIGGPPPSYQNFPPNSRSHRDYGRRMRERTPPGVIDDPLAAFNKMLREKDERERRAKQRNLRRSYSRSRSRSRSFSRSPVRRRSRSPRPVRRSRSRSRSFSLSRSRSRSFSGSLRGSPYRQLSPPRRSSPPPLPPRRGPSRYRSPIRSPPRNRHQPDRHRDRDYDDDRDRDYSRDDRPFKDNRRGRDSRDRRSRERDRDRYYDNYEDRRGPPRQPQWQQPPAMAPRPIQDSYYPPPDIQQGFQTNRYPQAPPRDYGPPFMNKEPPFNQPLPQTIHSIQPQRHYEDIAPPGVDDDIAPPGVEEPLFKMSEPKEHRSSPRNEDKGKENTDSKRIVDKKERERSPERKRRHEKRSRTPDKARNPSPKRKSKSKERDSPDKHRRRRRDSSDREEKDRDRRRDHSDDERSRKGKDKKKHKDKKESEKRKKRDKKEKHKKESKEKKPKEEFKQVIPKNADDDSEEERRQVEEKKKKEIEEERRTEEKRAETSKEEKRSEEKKKKATEEEKKKPSEEKKKKVTETRTSPELEEQKIDLYEDMLSEEIDTKVIENYGKIDETSFEENKEDILEVHEVEDVTEEGEIKEFEDEEKDVLELHSTDMDLKAEVDKSDILAPVPEKSKWEVEEDGQMLTSPQDSHKSDSKSDKSGKVTNEVLKRAENAIFAKAINAIRPIEIKKISTDRAKLYSGEREVEKGHNQIQVTVASAAVDAKRTDAPQPPVRLSVKERLGVKVEDTDKVINLARNRSRTISPFSRRGESGRNYALGERRVEVDDFRGHRDRNRRSRSRRRENSRDRFRNRNDTRHHRRHDHKRNDRRREHSNRKEDRSKHDDDKKTKRKRTRSRSESEERKDKHKKRDKKQKKEKPKKSKDDDSKEDKDEKDEVKPQPATNKRKPTIDEANFEPDYDLESHTDEEEEKDKKKDAKKHLEKEDDDKKSSSSESESESSSEEDRKKKKHKKHKKKKKRETSSSSSSESDSDSSDSDRDRKKKKHKKSKKKKKKSKHK